MAIKTISYTVSALGLEPSTKQSCGVQGDHNIYQLEFNIDSVLLNALQSEALNKGTLYYRFDVYNGEGAKASTEHQLLEGNVIYYNVEEWLTRFGGVGKVVLVITLSEDAVTHLELYSFPAVLQFRNRPTGSESKSGEYQSITTLAEAVRIAAAETLAARSEAVAARDVATNVKDAIENGVILHLNGKRKEPETDYFIISNEVREGGVNAVSGEAVYKALKAVEVKLNSAVAEIRAVAVLEAHPVGSLYWSNESTSPEILFGGTWQAVTDTFIIAAGEQFPAGSEGGSETATLTVSNLPSHSHTGIYFNDSTLVGLTGTSAIKEGYAVTGSSTLKTYPEGLETGKTGNGEAFPIMPPYKAYYCWKRTE